MINLINKKSVMAYAMLTSVLVTQHSIAQTQKPLSAETQQPTDVVPDQSVDTASQLSSSVSKVSLTEKIDQKDPHVMIQNAASRTFARIKDEQNNIKNDPEILRLIMEEELMPYIDYRFSAFKVLGKHARSVEKKDLLEFVTVFKEYLITSYAVAMGYYDDQTVEFEPASNYSNERDATIRAVIKDDTRPDIKVAFKVRKDQRTGNWQAYDMIAEGISMLSSKQSEFESVLRKEGIQKVIESMRESIRKPIKLQNKDDANAEVRIAGKAELNG